MDLNSISLSRKKRRTFIKTPTASDYDGRVAAPDSARQKQLNMVDSDNNSDDNSEDDPDEDDDDDSTFVSAIKGARAPVIRGTSIKSPTLANVGIRASNRRTQDAGNSDESDEDGDDDEDSEDDDDSEDESHLLQDKEDGDVALILRDVRFNGVIMKFAQELHCEKTTSRHIRNVEYRRLAERAMGDLKKGGGALLLQVGGTRNAGPIRGHRACSDAEAITRECDSSVIRCFDGESMVCTLRIFICCYPGF